MTDDIAAVPDGGAGTGYLDEMARTGFDKTVGLRYLEASPERVRVEWDVTPELHQPWGIVHGGVYCTVIESLASVAGQLWLDQRGGGGGHVVGVNNNTNFLRAVRSGRLHGHAEPLHRGRLQQLWRVTITDDDARPVADGQVRLQNVRAEQLGT